MHDDCGDQFADWRKFHRRAALQFVGQLRDRALIAVEGFRMQGVALSASLAASSVTHIEPRSVAHERVATG